MMKGVRSGWVWLVLVCASGGCRAQTAPATEVRAAPVAGVPIAAGKTQLVTVVSDEWDGFRAELRRYERLPGKEWQASGAPIEVVLGRGGYGWGRGLHGGGAPAGRPGPLKREGDLRSPAGVFEIGEAYGYAAAHEGLSLPYAQATPELRCVDDPASRHYNHIVSTASTPIDWKSAEHMRRKDDLYAMAIVVEHNARPVEPGAGSCIFIHAWKDPNNGMTGCTAMPMSTLEAFAKWLRPNAAVLVALPRSEYDALRRPWRLP